MRLAKHGHETLSQMIKKWAGSLYTGKGITRITYIRPEWFVVAING